MCGIAGFLQQSNRVVSLAALESMGEALTHRGPDDRGFCLLQAGVAGQTHGQTHGQTEGNVGLAQARLAIIDLSSLGHQPMSNAAGTIWIDYNGEVYNYREIRGELEGRGYAFRSTSDTEVVLHAYEEWGAECVKQFIGMFAIAIWDARTEQLLLIRDRLGVKPLYYYYRDQNLAFGSELKAILQYPYFEREIDVESLYLYLLFQYVPGPQTIFRNTYKLLPGQYLVASRAGDISLHTYWDAEEASRAAVTLSLNPNEGEALEQLRELLRSSVRYRLISDVPVGVLLSGGIDSSLVTAIAQESSKQRLKTFCIGFREPKFDESPYARRIAAHLGTEHHELFVTTKEAQAVVPQLPLLYDEPFADSSAIPTFLVAKLAREHVKVALSGDGGDELFGGYDRYEWVRAIHRYDFIPAAVRRGAAAVLGLLPDRTLDGLYRSARGLLPSTLRSLQPSQKRETLLQVLRHKDLLDLYLSVVALWRLPELRNVVGKEYDLSNLTLARILRHPIDRSVFRTLMLADLKTYLVDDGLTKVDRASMAASFEVRTPILDHRVVEYSLSLPMRYKHGKNLLKRLLSEYLPPELYQRPKQGFAIPLSDWLRGDLRYLVDVYLSPERLKREGFFNPDVIARLAMEHASQKRDHHHRLWSLIAFEIWLEHYGK
jgi:asparagine synthase (glutamine-hydrolysing)